MITRLYIKGFKTIESASLGFASLNVLIGANGAGKSNLVSFFHMIRAMAEGRLQHYIAQAGGADAVLFYGAKATAQIEFELLFQDESRAHTYGVALDHAAGDRLILAKEWIASKDGSFRDSLGTGGRESVLAEDSDDPIQTWIRQRIQSCGCFQFHDTSITAAIKQHGYLHDNRFLRGDGGNLAAFLYMVKARHSAYYHRIVTTLGQILPFFGDFVLEPARLNPQQIQLNWREKSSDKLFGPHQLSDGSLRMMALTTLLFQPEPLLPEVILIDEPELGLHPYALEMISALIRHASDYSQLIISTQSAALLDYFEPDQVLVVERPQKESQFTRLDANRLSQWLAEYSMAELWEKNVLGGSPLA